MSQSVKQQLIAIHSLQDGAAKRPHFLNRNWVLYKDIRRSVTAAEEVIFEQLANTFRKRGVRLDKYQLALRVLLANLWFAHLHSGELILPATTSRKRKESKYAGYSDPIGQKVVGFLEAQEYVARFPGVPNQYAKVAAWCVPTPKLLALIESCERTIEKIRKGLAVSLRKAKAKGQLKGEDVKLKGEQLETAEELGHVAEAMNCLLKHTKITYPRSTRAGAAGRRSHEIPVQLTRIFNNESWELGGRYYADHQSMPKQARRRLLINDEPVVELDYASLHARIVYAEAGEQFPLDEDPYGSGARRTVNKLIMLQLFNVSNEAALKSCITKSGQKRTKYHYRVYKNKYYAYLEGERKTQPTKPDMLKGYIEGMPVGTEGGPALAALKEDHPVIAARLEDSDETLGLHLQNVDSRIMTRVLGTLVAQGIPALPVHDSVIVPASKKDVARQAMADAFSAEFPGIAIPIKEEDA